MTARNNLLADGDFAQVNLTSGAPGVTTDPLRGNYTQTAPIGWFGTGGIGDFAPTAVASPAFAGSHVAYLTPNADLSQTFATGQLVTGTKLLISMDIGTRLDIPPSSGTVTITAKVGSTVIGQTTFNAATATPGNENALSFVTQDVPGTTIANGHRAPDVTLSILNGVNSQVLVGDVVVRQAIVFNVSSEAQLNSAIAAIDGSGAQAAANDVYVINITGSIALTSTLEAINLPAGGSLTVEGTDSNGQGSQVRSIDGGGSQRGFLVYSGNVAFDNLNIQNTVAQGGNGGEGGGGAGGGSAGLGGGLFVGSGSNVTLNNVNFIHDAAKGGNGGLINTSLGNEAGGGGGGLAQDGSTGSDFSGVGGAGGGADIPGVNSGGAGGVFSYDGLEGAGSAGGFGGGGGGGGSNGGGGAGAAGNGGFGGGGGGSSIQSGSGGFGGGGGSLGYFTYQFSSASGGWVDSGSIGLGIDPYLQGGPAGAGGWGAGAGGQAGGGGGLGAGGAVFVMQGATLNITGGTLANGTVTAGSGNGLNLDGVGPGSPGQAYGDGIFIEGNQSITFGTDQTAGQTTTINGDIADQGGGAGSVIIDGDGTVILGGHNTFSGGTEIKSGLLILTNADAGGSGSIRFSRAANLQINGTVMPSNTLAGFTTGDSIDLASIQYSPGGQASLNSATNVLRAVEGGHTYELHFNPGESFGGNSFYLEPDASGSGTKIILLPPPVRPAAALSEMANRSAAGSGGGTVTVSSGEIDSGAKVSSGVTLDVLSGGTVGGNTKVNGGALIMDAGAVSEPHAAVTMNGAGELILEQDSFKGTIRDFGGQDFIDLTKMKFIGHGANTTTETFTQTSAAGGILQVAQGTHVADLHFAGTYTTANFALQSDGTHGTIVTFVPNAAHG